MNYKEKAEKFREMAYAANGGENLKWRNKEELHSYLEMWGGRLKDDRRRRRGYLVSCLQEPSKLIVAEVPMDFALKVLSMGGFP